MLPSISALTVLLSLAALSAVTPARAQRLTTLDSVGVTFGGPVSATSWAPTLDRDGTPLPPEFHERVVLDGSKFLADVDMVSAAFRKRVSAVGTDFSADAEFTGTRFEGGADLSQTLFGNRAVFDAAVFRGSVAFDGAGFSDTLSLVGTSFEDAPTFRDATLPGFIDLRGVTVQNGVIDLSAAQSYGRPVLVDARGADPAKVRFLYGPIRLGFRGSSTLEDQTPVYQNFLSRYRASGDVTSARAIEIEYLDKVYAAHPVRGFLQRNWWLYGYEPVRVVWWSLALLLVFSLIATLDLHNLATRVYVMPFVRSREETGLRHWPERYLLAILYVGTLFFCLKFDVDRLGPIGWKTSFVIVVYAVGLICVGYLAKIIISP